MPLPRFLRFPNLRLPGLTACAVALTLGLGTGQPAHADLVIEGRAAQALHCSAMLYMVSSELYHGGYIARRTYESAIAASVIMLEYVPGTQDQKVQAMTQRFQRIVNSRTPKQLMDEFQKTSRWCERNFL